MIEADLRVDDERTLHFYAQDTHTGDTRLAVFWLHGTPNIGAPPSPRVHGRRPSRHPLARL